MKRNILILSLCTTILSTLDAQTEGCYRLQLKDKQGATYCSLSERAMARRNRQGITLDETDICISPLYLDQLRNMGWQIVTQSRWLNTVVVRRPDGKAINDTVFDKLSFITNHQQVTEALPQGHYAAPTHGSRQSKWELEGRPYNEIAKDTYRRPMAEVKGEKMYNAGYRGQDMLIAVLDGGFYNLPKMPFFIEKVVGWHDCYDREDPTGQALFQSSTHGTQVLSIMATDTTDGIWGTAAEARYYVIRTEYDPIEIPLEQDMWVEGAEHADSIGADLINSSLGYSTYDFSGFDATWDDLCQGTQQISRGAAIASQKGMLICNAAGNDRQLFWQYIGFPGDVEGVFTIGATDADRQPSTFTSVGWTTPYIKPDVSCRGTNSWILRADRGTPSTGSGTSYASPFMCGLMASLWSANPSLTAEQLKQIVRESAHHHTSPEELNGHGIPDFEKALQRVTSESSISVLQCETDHSIYYDLQGSRIEQPAKNGCFIVQNGKKKLFLNK